MEVLILSGAPGSGKSTIAKKMVADRPGRVGVCSADDYFMTDGKYVYDSVKIADAHAFCLRSFVSCLHDPDPYDMVVVDNTNIDVQDIAPYYALGVAFGCRTSIYTVMCEVEIAHKRCVHGAPLGTIMSACARLANRNIPHYWKEDRVWLKGNRV